MMETPHLRIESTGELVRLRPDVTTVGRGKSADVHLDHPSVSKLHAELVRRGPYVYVSDLGLSRNGTRVNGRVVAQRLLENGDVLAFGSQRCQVGGLPTESMLPEVSLRRSAIPELTRREIDVVAALCQPALSDEAFVAPATAREIAADLVVTEAAVKQHLLRLYQKLRIAEGPNRRTRLANEVMALGLVRPLPAAEPENHDARQAAAPAGPAAAAGPTPASPPAKPPTVRPSAARLPADSQLAS
jgi:pSer/pThr/pTyr-binding forkhead associated (FHA) protein